MIAKITRGGDTAGLLRYLLGPGRANEHTDPHLIATWDGDPAALEPLVVDGRPRVKELADLLDQPLDALHRRPTSTVWHCSLRNAPGDRRLSDQEWADAARRVLDRVGLAPAGDAHGCRWIAARHGADHIHLLVTLARQDGLPARTPNDYRSAGRACQEVEKSFGLTSTRPRDSTAVRRPTRPEVEKARRAGRQESTRETLRREVRLASLTALDPRAFLSELQRSGLLVKTRYSSQHPDQVTGYAVAWPGDHAPGGFPVWFSGSTLAPDLSLPRLQQRWDDVRDEMARLRASSTFEPTRHADWASIIRAVEAATTVPGAPADVARSTHAAASALTAVARVLEGHRGGALTSRSARLTGDLDRPAARSGSRSKHERQLLAAAHLVLRASGGGRSQVNEAVRLESALLDLLRVVASTSAPGSRPGHRAAAAAARMLDHSDDPVSADHPRTSSVVRVRPVPGVRSEERTAGLSRHRDWNDVPHRGR